VDPVPAQQTATPFENSYALFQGQFSRHRTAMRLQMSYNDEKYEGQPLFDRTRMTFDLNVERDLSSVLSAHIAANFSRQEYENLGRDFDDWTGTLGARWNFGRVSYASLDYQYMERRDRTTGGYSANEIWLRVAYLVGEGVTGSRDIASQ
jgi:uncharacterized protein (PEP-CTERM system associated)